MCTFYILCLLSFITSNCFCCCCYFVVVVVVVLAVICPCLFIPIISYPQSETFTLPWAQRHNRHHRFARLRSRDCVASPQSGNCAFELVTHALIRLH